MQAARDGQPERRGLVAASESADTRDMSFIDALSLRMRFARFGAARAGAAPRAPCASPRTISNRSAPANGAASTSLTSTASPSRNVSPVRDPDQGALSPPHKRK